MAKKTTAPATTPKSAKAETDKGNCACGCGEQVERVFKQGHDQRLVSKLAIDLVEGTGTGLGIVPKAEARADIQYRIDLVTEYVRTKLSPPLATKVYNAAMTRWALADVRATRAAEKLQRATDQAADRDTKRVAKAAKKAQDAAPAPEPEPVQPADGPALGGAVKIKVGRFEYDAQVVGMTQAGKVSAVTYTNRAGVERTINDPAKINLV